MVVYSLVRVDFLCQISERCSSWNGVRIWRWKLLVSFIYVQIKGQLLVGACCDYCGCHCSCSILRWRGGGGGGRWRGGALVAITWARLLLLVIRGRGRGWGCCRRRRRRRCSCGSRKEQWVLGGIYWANNWIWRWIFVYIRHRQVCWHCLMRWTHQVTDGRSWRGRAATVSAAAI